MFLILLEVYQGGKAASLSAIYQREFAPFQMDSDGTFTVASTTVQTIEAAKQHLFRRSVNQTGAKSVVALLEGPGNLLPGIFGK